MTLAQFPKNKLFKNHDTVLMKKLWIFFPEMTLAQFPKSDFFIFRWIFFPKMTLAQFPIFGFFFQDSRIGVKCRNGALNSDQVISDILCRWDIYYFGNVNTVVRL